MTAVFLSDSIWGHIVGTSLAFVKKSINGCVSLMVIYGTHNFKWPPENAERGQTWPSKFLTWGHH